MAIERFPVEAGHIMLFARSVGDSNQIYYDADYAVTTEPGAVIAHCKTLIAGFKCPGTVDIRQEPLPKSGAGKIQKFR